MNHLENTKIARGYWLTVPDENVATNLSFYRASTGTHTCATVACFGGWVCAMPEFIAMGVQTNKLGLPATNNYCGIGVSEFLFGDTGLFMSRGFCEYDDAMKHTATDHAIVLNRLDMHIASLSE